ncbi:MAG TPA: response regulator transcription factor [Arachnia sp.]|nr:response regulator transcription factor [Arachnia sp.]HMT85054.1 response regulator transcription factor [Arachnia sp.]
MTDGDLAESGLTVLVVDDDPWTTRAIAAVLGDDPAITAVAVAHDGAEAIAAYGAERPDVVLMDLNMSPGMGGVQAIEELKRRDPDVRIIVLTTVSPGPGLARALAAGARAVVRKTASDAELRAVVLAVVCEDDPRLLRGLAQDIVLSGDELPDTPAVVPRLTATEREVLILIAQGLGYNEIAERQFVAPSTVRSQAKSLREKLDADGLAQLVVRALQYRYISG